MSKPVIYIHDHVERLLSGLIPRFRTPNTRGLIRAFGRAVQDFEDTAYALIVERRLATARGDTLDQYGSIVGQVRQGESDALYRDLINARIITNIKGGQTKALLDVARLIFGPLAGPVRYIPAYPAAYRLTVYITGPLSAARKAQVKRWIEEDVSPAGVGVEHLTAAPRPAFTFDVDDDDDAAIVAGFDRGLWAVTL